MTIKPLLLTLITLFLIGCSPNSPTKKAFRHQTSTPTKTEAILKLDTKGHTALINDIIVTKSGDIISASNDKTIRVWDSKTGKEKRKILGQIGVSSEGKIYAIALSPNEEFLAIGGYFKSDDIRIYNYQSGKLLKVLKSHTNVVEDLAFSSNGKYLISGSQDNTAKIWKIEDFTLQETIKFHTNFVEAVKIIEKEGNYFAITAGFDNRIALYSMQTKKIVKSHKLGYKLMFLAISKNHIAVCGKGKEIQIYNHNLEPIKTIVSKTKPEGVAYSPNGKSLIAGTGGHPLNVNIYSVNQNYKKIQSFKKHKNLTMAVAFLDNQTVISGGGDNSEIYIWNIKTGKVLKKIVGVGKRVWSVGLKGDRVAWGNIDDCSGKNCSKFQKYINLKTFQIDNLKNQKFNRISTTYKNYQLSHRKGGDYGYADGVLDIKRDGKTIASITRDATNGIRHRCYGFYKNYIVSGGSNGQLKIYNLEGKEIANLVGHTGEVCSIAIDGDRLVSGSDDQTIRVWDLSKLKMKNEKRKIYEKILEDGIKRYNISRQKLLEIAENNNNVYNQVYISPKIQPQLSLFITKTNDWIAWTPQGFYNASKGGEKYIGYHINRGAEHKAEFLDISRFRKQFYRPDLIAKAIEGEDIRHYAQGIDIDGLLQGGLPPQVRIENEPIATDQESVEIGVKVCDMGGGVSNLNFYVDGKAIAFQKNIKGFREVKERGNGCQTIEQRISVPSGRHTVGFNATNQEGNVFSNTSTIIVTNTKQVTQKPNLHLLTLSINDYQDDALDLKFPNNDADELAKKLKTIGKSVFKNIYSYALKDSDVVKDKIYAKMTEIAKNVGENDVFVLYISGHGVTNEQNGDYYFIPYDCPKGADETKRAISKDDFHHIISKTKNSKFALLIDTCESGSMASKSFSSSIQRFGQNTGMAIIAGATSRQNAIDGYKKHGIFTYTVLDAMSNKKVYDFEDRISVGDIAQYVKKVLPRIAQKEFGHRQEPTIYMQGDTTFAVGGL